jgi:outer membrane protein OmpA-like peptidoglycan-associated protein
MSKELVVYGRFKGRYKTDQVMPLRIDEAYPDDAHKVQIYEGNLEAISFDETYQPEKHRIFKSFLLSNVENIAVTGTPQGPFNGQRVFDFTQFLIVEPVIESAHALNGATYGEISGMAYGITKERPKISKLDPQDPPPPPEPTNPNNPTNPDNPNRGGGTTGLGFNDDSEIGAFLERGRNGCSLLVQGCLSNFWRILGFLLLILFLWWLMKACSKMADEDTCTERNQNELILTELEKERDSVRKIYEENLQKALANINKIYFYRGSTEFHQYSLGSEGSLARLKNLIEVYDDKTFVIVGHHSGARVEKTNLDLLRAETVRNEFLNAGISGNRLEIKVEKDLQPLEKNKIYMYMLPDYSKREYNRNMRVEIQVKKP